MVYNHEPSVVVDRTFSIRTRLDASTVVAGSTAPEVSLATPASEAWAWAMPGMSANSIVAVRALTIPRIETSIPKLPLWFEQP